jgi:hypothetical protein
MHAAPKRVSDRFHLGTIDDFYQSEKIEFSFSFIEDIAPTR